MKKFPHFSASPLRVFLLAFLIAAALIFRFAPLAAALAAPEFPDNVSRPDTPGYLAPARSLASPWGAGWGRCLSVFKGL